MFIFYLLDKLAHSPEIKRVEGEAHDSFLSDSVVQEINSVSVMHFQCPRSGRNEIRG
jgi:hypothetical protein